jgi:hypothetical protein
MYIVLHVKYPLSISNLNETGIYSTNFLKIHKYQTLRKPRPVGAELSHADGQTDISNLIIVVRNFVKAS